ncbi:hypothetical protein ACEWY4_016399 [Coilia grayii]|uniref:Metalloendopeptidase n=1 Tax=Coilia grayii TaxID=363190 RepID=A0ABD1JLF1_9TELE
MFLLKGISGLLKEGDVATLRGRNAMKCNNCKWEKSPSGLVEVPYKISNDYAARQKEVIEDAMAIFHKKTCIRFVPYSNQRDYLNIMSGTGCWSYIGRIGGGQTVSLNLFGCVYQGVAQHELNHALGFYHEHTRSDRDNYVKINWEYVEKDAVGQFDKVDSNNLNTVYDYNSIMHYDRYAFSTTSGRETITPIPDPTVRVGPRGTLSETDIEKINKLYECGMSPVTTTPRPPTTTTTRTTTTTTTTGSLTKILLLLASPTYY